MTLTLTKMTIMKLIMTEANLKLWIKIAVMHLMKTQLTGQTKART